MIRDAIEYIVGLGEAKVFYEDGVAYSDKKVHKVPAPTAGFLELNSLSGLVDYIQSGFDHQDTVMIHVESPTVVTCFSKVNQDLKRHEWVRATAWVPNYSFDRFYDAETFNIKLQSVFCGTEDRDIMLKVVGNIKEEAVSTVGDDGTSQSVVAKTGIASVGNVKVPNPVSLAPYRTFAEIRQPLSDFVFRMQNGPQCALFEADGGRWKTEAMDTIKQYLREELSEMVESKQVHIIG